MSSAFTDRTVPLRQPRHAGLQPMHWRILVASLMGWIFEGLSPSPCHPIGVV